MSLAAFVSSFRSGALGLSFRSCFINLLGELGKSNSRRPLNELMIQEIRRTPYLSISPNVLLIFRTDPNLLLTASPVLASSCDDVTRETGI